MYTQHYARGMPTDELVLTGTTEKRGTVVEFTPDATIFETTEFHFDTLSSRLRELAFLNKGLRITIEDKRANKQHEFFYEGGIKSFVSFLNENKAPLHQV